MEAAYRLQLEEARAKRAGGAVEEPSAKRVKIETDDPEEGKVIRHVAPSSLQPIA